MLEADFPDAWRVNLYVRGMAYDGKHHDHNAAHALSDFKVGPVQRPALHACEGPAVLCSTV